MNLSTLCLAARTSLVFAALCVFSLRGLAVDEIGNGGDAVVCRDGSGEIRFAQTLDLYEAHRKHKLKVDLGDNSLNETQKALLALSRFEALDPGKAKDLADRVATFFDNVSFTDLDSKLPDIDDTGESELPGHCNLEQLAIQQKPLTSKDKLFKINQSLWNQLSADDRAALILHEAIFEMGIRLGHKISYRSRYLTAHLISDALPKGSLDEYNSWILQVGFEPATVYIGAVKVSASDLEEHDGRRHGKLFRDELLSFAHGVKLSAVAGSYVSFDAEDHVVEIETDNKVGISFEGCETTYFPLTSQPGRRFYRFHPNGVLSHAMNNEVCIPVSGSFVKVTDLVAPYSNELKYRALAFYDSGVLERAYANQPVALPAAPVASDSKYALLKIAPRSYFELHPTGFLKKGKLFEATTLRASTGETRVIPADTWIELNDDGTLK